MDQFPSPPAPPSLLWDMSTKMEGPGVREKRGAQHGGSRPLLDLPLFLRVLRTILHRVPLGLMGSAVSDFRPLTLFVFPSFVVVVLPSFVIIFPVGSDWVEMSIAVLVVCFFRPGVLPLQFSLCLVLFTQ